MPYKDPQDKRDWRASYRDEARKQSRNHAAANRAFRQAWLVLLFDAGTMTLGEQSKALRELMATHARGFSVGRIERLTRLPSVRVPQSDEERRDRKRRYYRANKPAFQERGRRYREANRLWLRLKNRLQDQNPARQERKRFNARLRYHFG